MFSAFEKMKAMQRELGFRRRVYPQQVMAGKMSQQQADMQIAICQEIADDYATLHNQLDLFERTQNGSPAKT